MEIEGYNVSDGDLVMPTLCGDRGKQDLFWSYSLSVNTSNPDLTTCFQRSVLLWIPCGLLWLSGLFYVVYLFCLPSIHKFCDFSVLNLIKILCAVILSGLTLLDVCLVFTSGMYNPPVDIMYYSLRFCTMVLSLVLVRWEYIVGRHTSGVLSCYWFLQLLVDIFILRSWVMRRSRQEGVEETLFITYCVYFTFVVSSALTQLFSDRSALWSHDQHQPMSDEAVPLLTKAQTTSYNYNSPKAMPDLTAPFWKTVTFLWISMDVIRGNRSVITFDNLYEIRPVDTCRHLLNRFYTVYNKGKSDRQLPLRSPVEVETERTSCLWALTRSILPPLILGFIICVSSLAFRLLSPIVLGWLIAWIESGDVFVWKGVLLALLLPILNILNAIFCHNYLLISFVIGMRMRTVINAIIYRKALRLSSSAKKLTTVGEILNLMSVDAQKLQDCCIYGNLVWEVPIEVGVCMSLIWSVIGPSTLSGLGVLLIVLPVNGFLVADCIRKLQAKQMKHKDERVKSINEVLSGMKIIKLYAWEPSFLKRISSTRKLELYYLKVSNLLSAISNTVWFLLPYLVSLAIFATFVLISPENVLDPGKAFVTMSFINAINFTLSILPLGVSFLGQGIVSLKRVSRFLEMDELEEGVVEDDPTMTVSVRAEDADFSWERDGRTVLKDINLEVPDGQLVAVVGQVGTGKSSLVSAILGEMVKHRGCIKVKGSVAYVPQQAWIQNASLRNNVLFGREHQDRRYSATLDACALIPDLHILTDGDLTEIGEKGINLSGGQKQRVSLARAVYQDEDIYLLDDPLSAVDAHVGKHIFDKVISNKGLLRKKTRILVTHSLRFLRQVDTVVVMHDGKISEMGQFDALIEQNGAFAEFLKNYFHEFSEYSSEEEEDIEALRSQLSAISGTDSELESSKTKLHKKTRKRTASKQSSKDMKLISQKSEHAPAKLIEEETAEEGNLRLRIIWRYLVAGGLFRFVLVIVFQTLFTTFQVLTSFWLSEWSSDEPVNGTMDGSQVRYRLGVYGGLGGGQGLFAGIALTASMLGCVAAAGTLHSDFISRIMRAPMAFFDTTPLGRIMNRISKDMDLIDTNLPVMIRLFFFCVGPVLATAFVVTYTTPMFIVAFIPIAIIYCLGQRMYIKYARQLKRIENIRRSPIFSHFDETIIGASSIRAYRRQTEFINKCDRIIDESQRPQYHTIIAQRWLGTSMEAIGGFMTFFAALFAVYAKDYISPGAAGLSVSYSLNVTVLLNSLIRCSTELETYMVAVERVVEYCNIDQEAEWRKEETETSRDWPEHGAISMKNYTTRYRPGLDLVLRNMTCDIQAGEKVGIVGRTGAGKSSLALALFRLIEASSGIINIDGINISELGLHNLRSRLTIIPQDPVIFSGSLRMNLDPFSEYPDDEVWTAVSSAHLQSFVESVPDQLEYECGEGGESLSVGQRQLVCLARALLRQSKVLVLDEATAAMDLETDSLIQSTIKDSFSHCTVLTIAHRLATVMDYDRIMVLDKGEVIEFESPNELIKKPNSVFYSLAKEAGLL